MSVSSAISDLTVSAKLQRHGQIAALSLAAVAALTLLTAAVVSKHQASSTRLRTTIHVDASRPLFSGWRQAGQANFDEAGQAANTPPPNWVLATEPSEHEVQALQSALADRPDKDSELARLLEYTRFQKQVALWSELQNGPMNSERSTLIQHLLEVLPDHYSRGELLGPQALLMAKALIQEIEPNPRARNSLLAEAKSRLEQQNHTIDESQLASQTAYESFQEQQKQIVSEYEASPVEQHNPLLLEARLDAARRNLLDGQLTALR